VQTETRVLLPQLCSRAERRRKGGTSAWPGVGDIGVKAGDAAALVFRRAQPRLASPRHCVQFSRLFNCTYKKFARKQS